MAQPFDLKRLALSGEPVPIAENLRISIGNRPLFGVFSVSPTGVLAYLTGSGRVSSRLVWLDRAGWQLDVFADSADYVDLSLSNDGARAAVTRYDPVVNTGDIWLFDVARKLPTRLTSDRADEGGPVWSADGSFVVFGANPKSSSTRFPAIFTGLRQQVSSGREEAKTLVERTGELDLGSRGAKFATSWSRDGKFILFNEAVIERSVMGLDLWVLPLGASPFPFIRTEFAEFGGQFSPDGRWVAYTSTESGRPEIYVASFPKAETRNRISPAGGAQPRWRNDGREIFYVSADSRMMAVTVNPGSETFEVGQVTPLFKAELPATRSPYAVTPDGQRFLIIAESRINPSRR